MKALVSLSQYPDTHIIRCLLSMEHSPLCSSAFLLNILYTVPSYLLASKMTIIVKENKPVYTVDVVISRRQLT